MARTGRKSEYNAELHKKIVDALSTGVSIRDVCAFVGISEDSYARWVKKYASFADDTARARTEARIGAAAVIRRSALGNKDAGIPANTEDAKWYLERTDPQQWGRTTKIILDVEPTIQKRLQSVATERGISLAALFEAWISELSEPNGDSEE